MKKGEVIRQLRRLYDIPQREIAEKIGVTQAAIVKFEREGVTDKRFEQVVVTIARLIVNESGNE